MRNWWPSSQLLSWHDHHCSSCRCKRQFGHATVPREWPLNQPLATWCQQQWDDHRKWEADRNFGVLRDPPMSDRIRKLEEIGFRWAMPRRVSWGERFRELQQFACVEGHCRVPRAWSQNPALGAWVARQQRSHKAMKEGRMCNEAGRMDATRVTKLESTGFEWSLGGSNSCFWAQMAHGSMALCFACCAGTGG
jgi:hypothetical protein